MKEQDKSAFMTWYRNGCISGTMEMALEKFRNLPFDEKRKLVEERKRDVKRIEEYRPEDCNAWCE